MSLHTPVCDLLNIEYPIVLAGMGGASPPRLAAAVSNAGGLGILGAAIPGVLRIALVHRAGAVFTSLYGYLLPVFGIILASIVFRSPPVRTLYVGAPIAFGGVALLQWARRHEARLDEDAVG